MSLTHLDEVAALVVIDMQKGVVALPTAHPMLAIIDRVTALCRAFRARNQPVVLVNVAGLAPGRVGLPFRFSPPPDWTELIAELDRQPDDYTVTKMQIGAFYGTGLDAILRRRRVTQVFLAGIMTSSGVEATARNAYDRGYNVVPVVDAMTDSTTEAHDHSVRSVFPRIGEVSATEETVTALQRGPATTSTRG
jgi:nicotinamidase-related amidase